MKKTFTVNIGGVILHIDEDAYQKLNNYLEKLTLHFREDPSKEEIMADIESRIAELLNEKTTKGQAVNIDHITEIIEIMGKPEDFDADTEEQKEAENKTKKKHKHLYRNPDDKMLGGVASGIAAYLNTDTALVRILLVILGFLSFGFSIILYLLFWIIVPEAETLSEKLEMRGEDISIENIKKNIQPEFEKVKNSVNAFVHSDNFKSTTKDIASVFGRITAIFFKVLFGLISAVIIFALVMIIIMIVSPAAIALLPPATTDPDVQYFLSVIDYKLFVIGGILLATAPLLAIFYVLSRIIFGAKSSSKLGLHIASILWTVGIIVLIIAVTKSIIDYPLLKEQITQGVQHFIELCKHKP
jgi:phage shock protein PspC (stress-responsive transcriptional regulator)